MSDNGKIFYISSKYLLNDIFSFLEYNYVLKLIKYNKKFQILINPVDEQKREKAENNKFCKKLTIILLSVIIFLKISLIISISIFLVKKNDKYIEENKSLYYYLIFELIYIVFSFIFDILPFIKFNENTKCLIALNPSIYIILFILSMLFIDKFRINFLFLFLMFIIGPLSIFIFVREKNWKYKNCCKKNTKNSFYY